MAIIGDILECTFNFSQGNKTANMVQFYEVTASTGGGVLESDIGYTLNEGMLAIAPTWLHTSAVYNGLYVKNMTNGLNYNERVEAESGDIGGDPAAAFIAASVKQQVGTLLTRAGFKRLPFIGEAQMNGETWVIGSTQETAILDYFSEVVIVLNEASPSTPTGETIRPVIVGRVLNSDVPPKYVLDLEKTQPVLSASNDGITSQNTRKR